MSSSIQQTSTLQQALRQVTETREYQQLLTVTQVRGKFWCLCGPLCPLSLGGV